MASVSPGQDGATRSADSDTGSFTVLDEDECRALLHDGVIGRVAFSIPELTIHPVNYAWVDGLVVFRTAATTTLAGLAGQRVAFEVDDIDSETGVAWSVLVRGLMEEGTMEAAEKITPWASGARPHVMVIRPTSLTGRTVSRPEEHR